MQHIAKEGRCFVISVNQFCKVLQIQENRVDLAVNNGSQVSDFPSDYPPFTKDHHDRQPDGTPWVPEAILNHGGSCIVGPLGTFATEPVWDKEAIVYAELRMDDVVESRVSLCCIKY
jgi:hypothetical protein